MSRRKKSRVHPKYKTKYRITNWPDYDRALAQRGSLTSARKRGSAMRPSGIGNRTIKLAAAGSYATPWPRAQPEPRAGASRRVH